MYRTSVYYMTSLTILILPFAVSGTDTIVVDENTANRLKEGLFNPATIFTGPQNSVHGKHFAGLAGYDSDQDTDISFDPDVGWMDHGNSTARERCEGDLERLENSILLETWAQNMVDAAGKPSSGILQGNIMWLGNYFECLNSSAPAEGNMTGFNGQYCTVLYLVEIGNFSLPVSFGVCLPDTCDADMLMNITGFKRKPMPGAFQMVGKTAGISCNPTKLPWDAPAIVMLTIISIFSALVLAGTLLTLYERLLETKNKMSPVPSRQDLAVNSVKSEDASQEALAHETDDRTVLFSNQYQEPKPPMWRRFLKCFCAITNGTKILDTSNKGEFRCVHGIRFLSMSWVILGHTYAFIQSTAFAVGAKQLLYRANTLAFQGVTHGIFAVDSFFLLSGFLLTFLFLKEADKKDGRINWGLYYFHRYWRLTPVYAVVLGFDYALTRYISHGPLWPVEGNEVVCETRWWWNLLYINNFQSDEYCMGWSWFLANDMQFYVISPIFLYSMWKWPKIGLPLVSSFILGSWICGAYISWHYDLLAGLSAMNVFESPDFMARMMNYFPKFYIKPYTRIGPYLIGMILGYLLYRENDRKFVLSRITQMIGWLLATVLSLVTVYGLYEQELTVTVTAIYNAVAPSIFTAALSWVIFTSLTGKGGFVNTILSHEVFIPLSRLTYCAYLVHPIIIIGYYQSLETNIQLTSVMATTLFLGFLVMSYMTAFATSLLFEAPFMALEKLFIKRT